MTLGIDIGISSVKAVLQEDNVILRKALWEGGFDERMLEDFFLDKDPSNIVITGVGSKGIDKLLGRSVRHVDEFEANAVAARQCCPENEFIVVSMGSGTSFVLIEENRSQHLGGSALGGGALIGMFNLLQEGGWERLRALAAQGNLSNIDTQIGDVCKEALPGLPMDTTAVNLGKASKSSSPEDIASGLINLVLQNIGVMANLAGSGRGISTYLMIGRLTTLPHAREIFNRLERLYGITLLVPQDAEFMTAFGASLYS